MKLLTIHDLLSLTGLRNPATIYSHIRKKNIHGVRRLRTDGGLSEWVFTLEEAERFSEWIKTTPKFYR